MSSLAKAVSSTDYVVNPYSFNSFYGQQQFVGDVPNGSITPPGTTPMAYSKFGTYGQINITPTNYSEELFQCRFFYRFDPTASTVLNRMSELASGKLKNRRDNCTDEEFNYFDALGYRITALLAACALEYLISGMAIPDYGTRKVMGNTLNRELGRKRYTVPEKMWARNPETIKLKRAPFGPDRRVYLKIPPEEASFITNKGMYPDGTEDVALYEMLVKDFPEYVKAIQDGKSEILLEDVRPILRKPLSNCDYPQPFLVPALAAMKHKLRIKEMDHSIATKAIEAILHVKAGSDEFPVTEDDDTLEQLMQKMQTRSINASNQLFYKFFTDHTVELKYVYPELEALLTPAKYEAVDSDIFMAMGFSRVLLVGEASKSNAGAGPQIILGPVSMLEELRERLLEWVRGLYDEMAEVNNFQNVPTPFFDPLVKSDITTLVGNASAAMEKGVISKNTYAGFFGTDFETEQKQIELEVDTLAKSPTLDQQVQLNQQKHTTPDVQPQDQKNPDGTITKAPEPARPSDMLNT